MKFPSFVSVLVIVLAVSALLVYAFPAPTVGFAVLVLLHAGLGAVATILLVPFLWKRFRTLGGWSRASWLAMFLAGVLGIVLLFIGTARPEWNWLYAHELIALVAVVGLAAEWLSRRRAPQASFMKVAATAIVCGLVVATISYGAWKQREVHWLRTHEIHNPATAPDTMNGEGGGPNGDFFPSSIRTVDGKKIPGQFFMESQACERCHGDVYKQWYSSMHHFSSFNNQWYRQSIIYMQDTIGTRPSKWCGGCHDPAVLLSGLMDTPIRKLGNRPELTAGLGCVMCHSIVKVNSTMGQGDFWLEYPELHDLAASKNPVVRAFHDFVVRLNPEPHRRVFLKPFMKTQPAEFCSGCHKVHLDVPVNSYRWSRGFNEYDNWQASGVSGFGARSFYYPPKPSQCADCHMPLVASKDAGAVNGMLHSHSFAAANTAIPTANGDTAQLEAVKKFLDGSVTVDIFAISPAHKLAVSTQAESDQQTTFAVGEEAETARATVDTGEQAPLTAPLNRVSAAVRRGEDYLVDVVVRTKRVGHFFPGGTVDAYDTWVELKATDDTGRVVFWSGEVEDNGRGPVEKGAHFYKSLLIDEHGNQINKRNAWASRAVVYVHLIPPGAADTVHYRLHVPPDVGPHINLTARLCYRKFAWWTTQFFYAGVPDPTQKDAKSAPEYDDHKYVFTGDTSTVAGKIKAIPDVPIVTISQDTATLNVLPRGGAAPEPKVALEKDDWTRWNDYGIGLFLQGDLKGARRAFEKITEVDPKNPDGWVNLGRVAVQEGDMDQARTVLEKALQISPNLARANFFYAKVLKNDGKYDDAIQRLRMVLEQYPRDRVAGNDLGRLLFLQRKYGEAMRQLQTVLTIDPEDLQAHYNLMLCYQGMGQPQKADEERKLYMRFKADESSQAITGEYRRLHPEDNNERQSIHEHVSVPLPGAAAKTVTRAKTQTAEPVAASKGRD